MPILAAYGAMATTAWGRFKQIAAQHLVFNPADKSAAVQLLNANRTLRYLTANGAARTVISKSAGKWYFEVHIDSGLTNDDHFIGIVNAAWSITAIPGFSGGGQSIAQGDSGNVWKNGSMVAPLYFPGFAIGDTIGVAFDLTNNKIWFSKNGTYVGNPATNTGGFAITPATYFPVVYVGGASSVSAATLVQTPLYTPPVGFLQL